MDKARLFIASSVESLPVAEAVNVNLDHDMEVTIWKNGTFNLSSSTIDDLVKKTSSVDFALFIFTPDDLATIREKEINIVRDNVLFELGLFIGAIGKERCFILKPRGVELHLPTDLLGVALADYDPDRSDDDLISSTNRTCTLVKQEVKRLGVISRVSISASQKILANPQNYDLKTPDLSFLAAALSTHTQHPEGVAFHVLANNVTEFDHNRLQITAIKLERMNLLDKTIEVDDQYGGEYYSYKITNDGIDILLKNEHLFDTVPPTKVPTSFDDIDF